MGITLSSALERGLGIGQTGEPFQVRRREGRPCLRDIESAVAGEARQEYVFETEFRGLAPGADIAHVRRLFFAVRKDAT